MSDFRCMYCGNSDHLKSHWEVVETHDPVAGACEVWFCCHPCRDARQPCETFHPLPEGWKA